MLDKSWKFEIYYYSTKGPACAEIIPTSLHFELCNNWNKFFQVWGISFLGESHYKFLLVLLGVCNFQPVPTSNNTRPAHFWCFSMKLNKNNSCIYFMSHFSRKRLVSDSTAECPVISSHVGMSEGHISKINQPNVFFSRLQCMYADAGRLVAFVETSDVVRIF